MFVRCAGSSTLLRAAAGFENVQDAWNHHLNAFTNKDVEQIMAGFTESSVVEQYTFPSGDHLVLTGPDQIKDFYDHLVNELNDLTKTEEEVTDSPAAKQSFLVWTAPSSNVHSGTDTFYFTPDNQILRQYIVRTQGSESKTYGDVTRYPQPDTQNEQIAADPEYHADDVKAAFYNHWDSAAAQNMKQLMKDYTDESELRAFDQNTGVETIARGRAQIQGCYDRLFAILKGMGDAKIWESFTDQPGGGGSSFVVWAVPDSGIISGTDSYIYDSQNKILRQNIVFTSMTPPELV